MNQRKYFEHWALLALLTTFFAFFSVQISDIDFWWHIAAGRQILEAGAIPSVDPFGVYDANNAVGQTILKSQWLGQVLLYLTYHWFDLDGIIFLRAGLLTLCLGVVYLRCRLALTAGLFSLSITALAGMAILLHTGERPQLFSFLYLSLTFLLLDSFAQNGKRWQLFCIPLLMLLWSNTHGGAVLGVAVLGLFGICTILEQRLSSGRFNTPHIKLMVMAICLSAVALVFTPNGLTTFEHLIFLENTPLRGRISEYTRPWDIWQTALYYWVFIGVTLVSLPGFINKTYWKQGAVVVVMGVISLTGYRYIPFFALPAAPYVAASLNRILSRVTFPTVALNLCALVIALAFLGYGFERERVFQHGLLQQKFPTGAVDFIKANHLGGKIFNTINWGGYLIWNLSGDATVFIDGRVLDPNRLIPYTHILWVTNEGRRFFEQGNFDLALVPHGNIFTGERYPLVAYLLNHPDWRNVYQDEVGYLFVRAKVGFIPTPIQK